MAENSLVNEAKSLGGKVAPWQGQLFVRVPATGKAGNFWVIAFYFSSLAELADLMEKVKARGWQPFTDVINLKVDENTQPSALQEPGPDDCPIHGTPLKPSKKSGWLFCPTKNADGGFCTFQRRVERSAGTRSPR